MQYGDFYYPLPANEPVLNYAPGSPEKKRLKEVLKELKSIKTDVPMYIGGEEVRTNKTLDIRPAKVYAVAFLDNHRLATGGTDDRVTIWDLDNQQPISQLVGHTGTVAALACDSTGNVLVSGSYDTTLCIWNLVTKKQIPATALRAPAGEAR